jgi:hypothetical protein
MRRSLRLTLPALALATATLSSGEAEAKGIMIITYGEAVLHYQDLPTEMHDALKTATGHDLKVGYLYDNFGLFWLDLWTWGGQYCLYEGDSVERLTPEQAAEVLGTTTDKLGKPLLYTLPLGLAILLGLGVGLAVFSRIGKSSTPAAPAADPPTT